MSIENIEIKACSTAPQKKIIVIESGFVYIGKCSKINCSLLGDSILIKSAYNIRYWGTEKGLGQLAIEGRQEATKMDLVGSVTVPMDKVIHIIDISEEALKTYNE